MYSVTPWLGRIGFEDSPTTAIVLYFFRSSRIVSALASAPSGSSTLIARRVHPCRRASKSLAPWPTSTGHFLPPFPPRSGSLPDPPSLLAAAHSRPFAATPRSAPSHPAPPPYTHNSPQSPRGGS